MERAADDEIARRLLERDESALREAIAVHGKTVHGMARRILAEATMAEEVAQDTFLALWRRPGAFDPARGSLQTFLVGVARNKAIDRVRGEESRRRTRDSLIAEAEARSADPPGEEPGAGLEEREAVKSALEKLPQAQREAIVLAFFGGRTYREVAVELRIPEGTAKTRLRDGLIRLRKLMANPKGS